MAGTDEGDELVGELERWQDAGAVWRVVRRGPDGITVGLLRCDGGEEVGRITSDAPAWRAFLTGRSTSED